MSKRNIRRDPSSKKRMILAVKAARDAYMVLAKAGRLSTDKRQYLCETLEFHGEDSDIYKGDDESLVRAWAICQLRMLYRYFQTEHFTPQGVRRLAKKHGGFPSRGSRGNDPSGVERDPETKRTIHRLELQLQEDSALTMSQALRIIEKLIALYQELGDMRGVLRYKSMHKRYSEISAKGALREKRRGQRAPRALGRSMRSHVQQSHPGAEVLWSKDDLALIHLKGQHLAVMLIQYQTWGVRRFHDVDEAIDYLHQKYGEHIMKANDPSRLRARKKR